MNAPQPDDLTVYTTNLVDVSSDEIPFEEIGRQLQTLLGLERPLADNIVLAVVDDPLLLHHLIVVKNEPALFKMLLTSALPAETKATAEVGGAQLTLRAANAFLKWASSGFGLVSEAQYKQRLDACSCCPHYVAPPNTPLYRLAKAVGSTGGDKICDLCGCVVAKKARLPTETCPDSSATQPGYNRWGERLNTVS